MGILGYNQTMEFTETDRQHIMKLVKQHNELKGNFERRISDLEKISSKPLAEAVPSPFTREHIGKHKEAAQSDSSQAVRIIFKPNAGTEDQQRILVTSLYKTLKELCDKNGIETMDICINNKVY